MAGPVPSFAPARRTECSPNGLDPLACEMSEVYAASESHSNGERSLEHVFQRKKPARGFSAARHPKWPRGTGLAPDVGHPVDELGTCQVQRSLEHHLVIPLPHPGRPGSAVESFLSSRRKVYSPTRFVSCLLPDPLVRSLKLFVLFDCAYWGTRLSRRWLLGRVSRCLVASEAPSGRRPGQQQALPRRLPHQDDDRDTTAPAIQPPTSAIISSGITSTMVLRISRALAVGTLLLGWLAAAQSNYTSADMLRAQLRLMGDRPEDCPPWYGHVVLASGVRFWISLTLGPPQFQLSPPALQLRTIRRVQRVRWNL